MSMISDFSTSAQRSEGHLLRPPNVFCVCVRVPNGMIPPLWVTFVADISSLNVTQSFPSPLAIQIVAGLRLACLLVSSHWLVCRMFSTPVIFNPSGSKSACCAPDIVSYIYLLLETWPFCILCLNVLDR